MAARPVPRSRRRVRPAGAALAVLLALCAPALAQVEENALKAAFVYNIISFASWDGPLRREVLVVCTAVDPGLSAALATLDGRQVAERRLSFRAARDMPAGCDVLVRAAASPAVSAQPGRLVVCDGCVLPDAVTSVALGRDGARLRFDVDAAVASDAGVTFSSRLLRLARRVL
ncbi:YfiR family protein [Luteimonas sp. SJ-16]|uniref:YfiR family protein n=1 Tax=Luteimonas deserti TaxID=2752306 RepID=A0A7Z0QR26_9GAMM|nr:YfiR family protein [Luteimonas deserti]